MSPAIHRPAVLLCILVLAGCAAEAPLPGAPAPSPRPVAGAAPVSGPDALAALLPTRLGDFERGGDTAITEPLPGREVAYATSGRAAAGFVQVLRPGAPMPDGAASPIVQTEFRRMVEDATRGAMEHRRLRLVRETDEAGLFRCAELEGTYGRQPMRSHVCVGAARGQLVRLRASMSRQDPPVADVPRFVRDAAEALRRG